MKTFGAATAMARPRVLLLLLSCCLAQLSIVQGSCENVKNNGFLIRTPKKSVLHFRTASEAKGSIKAKKIDLDMAQQYCQAVGGKLPEPKTKDSLNDLTDSLEFLREKEEDNKIRFFFGYNKRNSNDKFLSLTTKEKLPDELKDMLSGTGDCVVHRHHAHEDKDDEMNKADCDKDNEVDTVVCEMECNENSATLGRKFKATIKAETQGSEPCTEQSRIVCEVELEPKTNSEVKISVPAGSKSYILKGDPSETKYRKVLYQEHGYFQYECQATLHILGLEIKTTNTTAFIQCQNSQSPGVESQLQNLTHSLGELVQHQTANENTKKNGATESDNKSTLVLAATSVVITIICILVVVPILVIVFVMFRRKKAEDGSVDLEAPSRRTSDRSRYSSRVGSTRSVLPTTTTGTAKSVTCKTKPKSFTFSATKFKSNPSSLSTTTKT